MIEEILPDEVLAVESGEDLVDARLYPVEETVITNAVSKRRREFTTARACARTALTRLALPEQPLPTGPHGEPCWPAGVVGSITHCDGYRACAVARATAVMTIGIDAEPNAPLPGDVRAEITRPEELRWIHDFTRAVPAVHWDRVLFSAKESVYKAWFPLARRWLGFEDAVVTVDLSAGTFHARLLVAGPSLGGAPVTGFSGRWLVRDGLVLTAIAVANPACAPCAHALDQRERIKERSDPATPGTARP